MKSKLFLLVIVLSIFINCKKEPLKVDKIKEFAGDITEWSNMKKGSWWVYKDLEKDSLLDTIFIVKIVDSLYIYKMDFVQDSTITYKYIERYYQLSFYKDSLDKINEVNFLSCRDDRTFCYEYLFSSKNNNMIISPNNTIFFNNGFYDTVYFDTILYYITYKRLKIENYISLYFPIQNNQEYSNECNYYLVQDFFENITIQNHNYKNVYLLKSKAKININGLDSEDNYIFCWINQDYGLLKLKIERDDMTKNLELINSNIIKD